VRRYRREAELTQEALAERAGLSVRAVRDIEAGSKHRPRQDTVRLLLDALAVPEDEQPAFWATTGRLDWNGMLARELPPGSAERDSSGRACSPSLPGGFLGAHPDGPLVGREAEHARLVALVDAAALGIGRLVTITGEPGAGKTRLAQELTLDLEARGFMIATGRCFEQQERIPYAPFLDALPALYAVAPASLRREAAERWPYLAPLLPDELPPIQGASSDPQGDQLRVFRALTRFVLALAAERPLALLLDDLHWADGASLDLLRHLALDTREARVFLAAIHRPVPRRHPLQAMVRDLARDGLLERIALGPLERSGTASLLATRLAEAKVPDQLVDMVQERVEGNPFFTIEIMRVLLERGDIAIRDEAWALRAGSDITVPESVRLAIDERVGRLPEGVQTLLGQASVLGHAFGANELVSMSGRETEEVEEALEAAADAKLLQAQDEETFAFSHVLVQQALYEDLSGPRKRRLHLSAGRGLEAMPERRRRAPADLAWHFRKAMSAERAFHWTLLAGDQAEASFAHAEAEEQYRLALDLALELGDAEAEASVREKRARVLTNLGRPDDAIREADEAIKLYRQVGDLDGEARVAGVGAHLGLGGRERQLELRALLETLRPQLEARGPSSTLAGLYSHLGVLFGEYGEVGRCLDLAERGSEVARAAGDGAWLFWCELMRGNALYLLGRAGEAESVLQPLVDAEDGDAVPLDLWASAPLHLGVALALQGQLTEGIRHAEHALDRAERSDSPLKIQYVLSVLDVMECVAGNWEAARRYAERVVAIADKMPREGWRQAMGIIWLGKIALYQGSIAEGERRLLDVIARSDRPEFVWDATAGLADQDLFAGRAEAALRRLSPLPRSGQIPDLSNVDVLARAYLATGEAAEAEAILTTWIAQCKRKFPQQCIDALWSLGAAQAAREHWAEADASFTEAVALAHEMPYPYAEARALYHWGLAFLQRQRIAEARERLEDALLVFERLGATPYVERTKQMLETV
jgi:tetratricopeptide (TPR) repeat protein/DNA-binding XRE family transcriptional regulator